jgi:glycosyltransferase involved in cell wall biosynthesis
VTARRVRVLHVAAVDFTAAKLLRPQLEFLATAGFDVRVACGRTSPEHWWLLEEFAPVNIPFPRAIRALETGRALVKLRRTAHEWRPDVMHVHTPAAAIPVRATPRKAWPERMRTVYTVHGYLHSWPPRTAREKLIQRVEQWESRRCDLTLFQSMEDLSEARARGYGGSPTYLGNGVEDSWFEIPPPTRKPTHDLRVLFVGRLVREKGVLDLAQAIEDLPGVTLHVAGDALASDRDSVAADLRLLAGGQLRSRMVLHGMVSRAEVQRLYRMAHVMCLPSYREGVPRSVIEALAAGRPVIASTIRGNRELVTEGLNGHLFAPGDIAGLRDALTSLRDVGSPRFGAMSAAARASAAAALRESSVFQRLRQGYQQVLEAPSVHTETERKG